MKNNIKNVVNFVLTTVASIGRQCKEALVLSKLTEIGLKQSDLPFAPTLHQVTIDNVLVTRSQYNAIKDKLPKCAISGKAVSATYYVVNGKAIRQAYGQCLTMSVADLKASIKSYNDDKTANKAA